MMTNEERKIKIDKNNQLIEDLSDFSHSVLNLTIVKIQEENSQLQEECTHVFEDGSCKYCYFCSK